MTPPAPRVAVLDLDGTLVDSFADLAGSVNHALRAVGLPARPLSEVRTFIGEGARLLLQRAVDPHLHLLEPALAAWWEHYEAHCLDHTTLFPGVAEALAGAGRVLAVHTNKPGRLARKILDGLQVGSRFAAVLGGDEAPRKPDPTGTLGLVARLGGDPSQSVFVGDSLIDAQTAAAAGVPFVAVTWGFGARDALRARHPAAIVDAAAGLAPWLE
ncbi:MAG TPA: HAD hydrolase-like protein [Anaeromyxobacteraceae bacterium]|nr:HAD hydrolase-like protein [Anaeromyxobacteraceae bacterium]